MRAALKWGMRLIFLYAAFVALILTAALISVMLSFTFVILNELAGVEKLGSISEKYLSPLSERLWNFFLLVTPGG
ncbi:hypothetical protein [Alteribacillus sp. HJP-4]|uniref:hypothetical protein n=1 Tax=Alteribacillus sp. HJP-4 TaxID=2775394 RepID=UPI0035CD1838